MIKNYNIDSKNLIQWFEEHQRNLPFRETKNPYFIWVSEVMLQQTQMDSVIPYYETFINKYPSIKTLAEAELEDILNIVQGIGYYRRFKLLHQGAKYIMEHHEGIFPSNYQEVLKIPGIGRYTAGAIMSIAYNKPYAATDGNVIRVLSRYFMLDDDFRLDVNKKKIDTINQHLIEGVENRRSYTEGLMELGALVCNVSNPQCQACPLNQTCMAFKADKVLDYPNIGSLAPKKELTKYHFILQNSDGILMRKREDSLLYGLYEFVSLDAQSFDDAINQLKMLNIDATNLVEHGLVKHIFTHQIWYNHVVSGILILNSNESYQYVKNPYDYPMSTLHKKIYLKSKKQ